jgi:hypothetical protein
VTKTTIKLKPEQERIIQEDIAGDADIAFYVCARHVMEAALMPPVTGHGQVGGTNTRTCGAGLFWLCTGCLE